MAVLDGGLPRWKELGRAWRVCDSNRPQRSCLGSWRLTLVQRVGFLCGRLWLAELVPRSRSKLGCLLRSRSKPAFHHGEMQAKCALSKRVATPGARLPLRGGGAQYAAACKACSLECRGLRCALLPRDLVGCLWLPDSSYTIVMEKIISFDPPPDAKSHF